MDDTLRNLFPELYRPLLPSFFDTARPKEDKATCNACAMCPPAGAPPSDDVTYFRPDTKCCTYHPRLPNYLIGGLLADESPEMQLGRRLMRERIASRVSVSPRCIAPPRKLEVLRIASWKNSMGRSLMLRCPFYGADSGNCTVWRYREIECTTFFCKYNAGKDGEAFWKSLREYMYGVQYTLAEWAVRSIIPGYDEPPDTGLTLEDMEDLPPNAKAYSALWGEWEGREEELYVECHRKVTALRLDEFEEIVGGAKHDRTLADMARAHEAMVSPTLPERLVPNPEMGARPIEGGVLAKTYSPYEPLMLTEALYEVIREFSAKETVAEVRERLAREAGVDVPLELLVSLYQFRVLVPPGS